jgi:hypothetical protein
MEGERRTQSLRSMAALDYMQIRAQFFAEFRMCAVVDDQLGALVRGPPAKICDTMFGHDDLDRVFAMNRMRNGYRLDSLQYSGSDL